MAEKIVSAVAEHDYVVIESGKTTLKDLYSKEDWMAIWMGFLILIIGLLIFLPRPPAKMAENIAKSNEIMKAEATMAPFKTVAWHQAANAKKGIKATDQPFAKTIQKYFNPPSRWTSNPLDAVYRSQAAADALNARGKEGFERAQTAAAVALSKAQISEEAAAAAGFSDTTLNAQAETDIAAWVAANGKISKAKATATNKPFNRIPYLIGLAVIFGIFFGIGKAIMGQSFGKFFVGFFFVFFIAVLAYMGETQTTMKHWGFGLPPSGCSRRSPPNSSSRPAWCCWALKFSWARSWPSANRVSSWPGSAPPSP